MIILFFFFCFFCYIFLSNKYSIYSKFL
jgi:hypothetical protein